MIMTVQYMYVTIQVFNFYKRNRKNYLAVFTEILEYNWLTNLSKSVSVPLVERTLWA